MMRRISLLFFLLLSLTVQSGLAAEPKVYFGLMHGHTSYSDGRGKPDDAFKMAKEAGLDFLAITEHNHSQAAGDDGVFLTPPLYGDLIDKAKRHTKTGEFVGIWGQEFSTISKGNHVNLFFANEICNVPNGEFKKLYEEWLPDHAEVPFIQFNHPGAKADQRPSTPASQRNNDYGIDDYDEDFEALVAAAGKHVALIELVIGPAFSESTDKLHHNAKHEPDYLFYLNKGLRLAPSAGQDNHFETWGLATEARIGVWADELSPTGLIDAIRNRRTFATEDENLSVHFSINDSLMGSSIAPTSGAAVIKVTVKDEDETDAKYRVRLYYDDAVDGDIAKVVENQEIPDGEDSVEFLHTPEVGGYYFVKITQTGDDHNDDAWTAPIWIDSRIVPFGAAARNLAANTDDPEKKAIDWSEATDYVGKEVTVTGQIVRTFKFGDKAVFFNFDDDYENTLNLIILGSDFDEFGGADGIAKLQKKLINKSVKVKGPISLYRGERVQLRLQKKEQLLEVTDAPQDETRE